MSGMEQNLKVEWQCKTTGIPDNLFSRSKAGLTREEIRSIIASKAEKKVIFTMPAKICDMLGIDAREHFNFEFSSVWQLVERLKKTDYERLKTFFDTLAEDLSQKTDADVYVFDNSGDMLGCFLKMQNEKCKNKEQTRK